MALDNKIIYIGITGKAGSGKDTLCDYLLEGLKENEALFSGARFALADNLKETCANMYKVPVEIFHDRDNKETPMDKLNGQSPREVLQQFGTEYVRENLGSDHWIKMVEKDISAFDFNYAMSGKIKVVIIPDVRFENERNWIHDNAGWLIKIERDDLDVGEIDTTHASEAEAYTDYTYDYLVDNNKSLSHLFIASRSFLNVAGL